MGILIFGIIFGIFIIYKSRKIEAKLLFLLGIGNILMALVWLGSCCDFLTILITGRNIDTRLGILGFFGGNMWIAPVIVLVIYIGAELLLPKQKWYIVAIFVILGVIYELFLFLDPAGSVSFVHPSPPGSDLIDDSIIMFSPVWILLVIFMLSVFILDGFGFLYYGIKTSGEARKGFLLTSLGFFLFITMSVLDAGLGSTGFIFIIDRCGFICAFWLLYLGLK